MGDDALPQPPLSPAPVPGDPTRAANPPAPAPIGLDLFLKNATGVVALVSGMIALGLPFTEWVKGRAELAIKRQEHADAIELEFVKLLTSKDTGQTERRNVLGLLADPESPGPLQKWAKRNADDFDAETRRRADLQAKYNAQIAKADEFDRNLGVATAAVEAMEARIGDADLRHDDPGTVEKLRNDLIVLRDRERMAKDAWNRAEQAKASAGGELARSKPPTLITFAAPRPSIPVPTPSPAKPSVVQAPVVPAPGSAPSTAAAPAGDTSLVARITPGLWRALFPRAAPANVDHFGPVIVAALIEARLTDRDMLLVALATLAVEDPLLTTNEERSDIGNTTPGGAPFDRYDGRLGNSQPGDGARYRGRGFLWITGRANYAMVARTIGVDIVAAPERLLDPTTAARAYASYLAANAARYRAAARAGDFSAVRKITVGSPSANVAAFRQAWRIGAAALDAA